MKKLFKFIAGLTVLFFVLVIAVVFILPVVITPDDYKPQIIQLVKQETGRDLVIEDEIKLNFFPKIGLALGRTELSNAPGFKESIFAKVEAVNIQVALLPLIDKKLEMDEIVLQGLVLNLHRAKNGTTNWEDLAGKGGKKEKTSKKGQPPALAALTVGGIRIEDAQIHWQDDVAGKKYDIENFNLISGPLAAGDPVEIELNSDLNSNAPALKATIRLKTTVQVNDDQNVFSFSALGLNLDATGKTLPGGSISGELGAKQLSIDLAKQLLTLTGMDAKLSGVAVNGALTGKAILGDAPQFSGHLEVPVFNARQVLKTIGQEVPEMADPASLTRIAAGFDISASTRQARLAKLKLQIDDTHLTGLLAVENFSNPAITFDLDVDQIDLDRYQAVTSAAGSGQVQPASKGAQAASDSEAELFPVETLKKLNANGEMRIGQLKKNNLKASDIVVKVKAKSGHVNLKPTAKLYQGQYDADVTVDAQSTTPRLKVDANLQGVQVEPLLKDLQGKAKISGQTNATININSTGNSQKAVKQNLQGNLNFSFHDGALVGVNIAKIIREGWAKLKGKSVPKTNEPDKTDFSELKGSARITNGVIDNQDLFMSSPLLRLTGAGQADLVKENLNYLLKASIVGTLEGQGGEDLSKLKGVTIPVRVSGPFASPSYSPDLSAALSDTVKSKVKEKVDKKKDAAKQKIEDKLKGKLKGIFSF